MTKTELQQTHPDYDTWLPEWLFFMRSYFGGKRYRDGNYLIKHSLESQSNYERRKKMAYFYNYCAPVVDIFNSLLYATEPERKYGNLGDEEFFKSFLEDADFDGNSFKQFAREAQRFASIYGRINILIDKSSAKVETQADQEALNIRPYLTIITPEKIVDWRYDRDISGKPFLAFVKIKEGEGLYRIWTPEAWALFSIDGDVGDDDQVMAIEGAKHDLGEVPIVTLYNKTTLTRMLGVSDLEDISYVNRNTFYLCSDAQEVVENTAFPMLAMKIESGDDETKTIGPRNILPIDDEPGSNPYWLEAPHTSLAAIEVRINNNGREIYKNANLSGVKTSESVQPWSGIAIDIENQQRNANLSEKAANQEEAETETMRIVALWMGKVFDGSINYVENWDITDANNEVQNNINALNQVEPLSPTMVREQQKKLSRNILPKLPKEIQTKIDTEIDEAIIPSSNNSDSGNEKTQIDEVNDEGS